MSKTKQKVKEVNANKSKIKPINCSQAYLTIALVRVDLALSSQTSTRALLFLDPFRNPLVLWSTF